MIAHQLSLGLNHRNHQLFSDHYLNTILPARPEWAALVLSASSTMDAVKATFAKYRPSSNEAQTEHFLIQPILDALGHTYDVQPTLRTAGRMPGRPDYVFYRDASSRDAQKGALLTDSLPSLGGLAIGDAKYWDRPLDKALKVGDALTNQNPSWQIAFYIQHSGVDWGILTNGRLWRLYHRDTAHKLDRFYEVDLAELIAAGDPHRFLYFYAFFHRSAFDPGNPFGNTETLHQSLTYARTVGDTLKAQVYEALRHLAQGFLDYKPNALQRDPATLKQIYDASLIVLYRLLFVLYAEARELLPVRANEEYRADYSLDSVKRAVELRVKAGRRPPTGTATIWPRVKTLFEIIDKGNPPLAVATFNGGLFDPQKHPFLEQNIVGDAHLQQAIDKLCRVGDQFVDFRDLAVRHLGTIYEGLLEFHLLPVDDQGDGWSVALLNDRGERHATGSYYTPDFIVKYIVDQALRPALETAVTTAKDDDAKVAAVLDLNVLDPAMGSGHFLVEATEYIAQFLVEQGIAIPGATETREDDLAHWKRRVVQSCIYGVDLNPLAVELSKLSLWIATVAKERPLSFLDHHLRSGNSLVGARLTDLRVVGPKQTRRLKLAQEQSADAGTQQLSMLDNAEFLVALTNAVTSMWLIEDSPAETVGEVKEQERVFNQLRAALHAKHGRLADLVLAPAFGFQFDTQKDQFKALASYAMGRGIAPVRQFEALLDAAGDVSKAQHFFHWELDFPEIYFDRNGNHLGDRAGFDAVVGNPPYVRQEGLRTIKTYLGKAFPEVFDTAAGARPPGRSRSCSTGCRSRRTCSWWQPPTTSGSWRRSRSGRVASAASCSSTSPTTPTAPTSSASTWPSGAGTHSSSTWRHSRRPRRVSRERRSKRP